MDNKASNRRAADNPRPEVSVVIVSWNSVADLRTCLEHLRAQTERRFETIVVDNASSDQSPQMVRREFPEVIVEETGANLGFAQGCNRGIAISRGTWVVTLNADTEVEPTWLAQLLQAAQAGPARLGMLQSRVVQRLQPDRLACTGVQLLVGGRTRDRHQGSPSSAAPEQDEVFCVSAAAAMYRRAMLDQTALSTGIFDATYFMYFEDVDLGWRCRLAGWTALYVPTAVVRHTVHGSVRQRGDRFADIHYRRNRLRTVLKNGTGTLIVSAVPVLALDALRLLRWEGPKAAPSLVSAVVDGVRLRREVNRLGGAARVAVERRWVSWRGA